MDDKGVYTLYFQLYNKEFLNSVPLSDKIQVDPENLA